MHQVHIGALCQLTPGSGTVQQLSDKGPLAGDEDGLEPLAQLRLARQISQESSGRFATNSAWAICAAICHNLLRAAGTVIGGRYAVARGATLRRHLVTVPARLARPAGRRVLHLPAHWPWAEHWTALWTRATGPPAAA